MQQHKETLAVAESVSAGHLQAIISGADEAMLFFQGGITTYNLGQKARHLKVDPIHGLSCNCVSERIASQMAMGVTELFSSSWGIGIVGYAKKVPEQGIKDLFALYAIAHNNTVTHTGRIEGMNKNVAAVQRHYVDALLRDFVGHLKGS
jgi:nicotinamide-nucleotide amidase